MFPSCAIPASARAFVSVIKPHPGSVGERSVFVTNVYHGSVDTTIPEPEVPRDTEGGSAINCE